MNKAVFLDRDGVLTHSKVINNRAYAPLNLKQFYIYKRAVSIITNDELFGFVKNSMIPIDPPIILNWNQHGQMMKKVVEEHKINNLKLLPNSELSLSWNREMNQYFIDTRE